MASAALTKYVHYPHTRTFVLIFLCVQMEVDDEGGPSPTVFSAKGNTLDESVNKLKESLICQPCTSYSHDYSPCPTQSHPHAEVRYMPLFNIKGVDTKSRAYLKSVNTQPEIVHVVPSFKRMCTALTQQHDLLGDQASGSLPISFTYLDILCYSRFHKSWCGFLFGNEIKI